MCDFSFFHKGICILCLASILSCQKKAQQQDNKELNSTVKTAIQKTVSTESIKKKLVKDGFQVFDYVDEESGDTILMQQYFIAFLKKGSNRSQNKKEADSLQKLHLEHLGKMYKEGYADISGPFGNDGDIRGITIYNTPTQQIADSLANLDPMVRSKRLTVEIHPWWAAKGFSLR